MPFIFKNNLDKAKTYTILSGLIFNQMTTSKKFWDGIPLDKNFTHTDLSTSDLIKEMQLFLALNHGVKISFYRSSWLYRGVVANVKSSQKLRLNFNTRHFDFPLRKNETPIDDLSTKICTLSHEVVHIADNYSSYYFGHGSNSPEGKENSFPYWFGNYCKKYFIENFGEFESISIYNYLFIN